MQSGVVGLLPNDLRKITLDDIRELRALGFTGTTVPLGEPDQYRPEEFQRIRDMLHGEGVAVAQANGLYPSLVDHDEKVRAAGVEGLKRHMQATRLLEAHTLYVRPGSLNPAGSWAPHPEHQGDRVFERVISSLTAVAVAADAEGVILSLEGHVLSVIDRPSRVAEGLRRVPARSLGMNLDPVNFVGSIWDAWTPQALINRLLDATRGRVVAAHWKDYIVDNPLVLHISEVPIGEGLVDHVAGLTALNEAAPDTWVLIEHLPPEQIPAAKRNIDAAMSEASLTWDER